MITKCMKCGMVERSYTYLPALDNMHVCYKCHRYWDKWGLVIFKRMINYE